MADTRGEPTQQLVRLERQYFDAAAGGDYAAAEDLAGEAVYLCKQQADLWEAQRERWLEGQLALAMMRQRHACPVPRCCYIGCGHKTEWIVVTDPSPDGYTEACGEHVGALLDPTVDNVVRYVGEG